MGKMAKDFQLSGELSIDLKTRGRVYEACVRSALLYGTETWSHVIQKCDCKVLRYMVGVKW